MEHQAIDAHMCYIVDALVRLARQSSSGAAAAVLVRSQVRNYRWNLYDLRDILQSHIALDESVFSLPEHLYSKTDMARGHQEIKEHVANTIRLADSTIENALDEDELRQRVLDLKEAVSGILELVRGHMAREDAALNLVHDGEVKT